jgi:ParB family chromosome partitioning protein
LPFAKDKKAPNSQRVTEIAVESIALNPLRPRQNFEEKGLRELAQSVRKPGDMQPVIVRAVGNAYELVVGERRFRAAQLAGLRKIPAVVREMDAQELAVFGLIEDLQREDLSVIEEARGFKRLLEEYKFTQSEVGRLAGKGQSTIANKLRLLRLPEAVQSRIVSDGVSERHARALLELPDATWQMRVLDEIRDRGLSVRETEERVRGLSGRDLPEGPVGGPGVGRRGAGGGQLEHVSGRRAIRAFRDLRLFLNTFRRTVDVLKDAGIRAEMTESDGPEFLEIKVLIPKVGAVAQYGFRAPGAAADAEPDGERAGKSWSGPKASPGGRG